jgi:PAS domain S-box-containing protein
MLEHLGRLSDVTHELLGVIGFDGRFKFLNSSWESILGYSQEELMASPHIERVHPDDRAATVADVLKVAHGSPSTSFENRQRCKDGSYKWISWSTIASLSQQCFYVAGRDITEHKRSNDRVLQLAQALENNSEMICMGDDKGRAVFVNQALLRASGYREEEIIGKSFDETLLSPDNPPTLAEEIRTCVIAGGTWRGECLQRRKNGRDLNVALSIGVIRDREGRVTGSFGISQDITERKQLEEQLRRAQKMEAVGQLAGGVAHDFNNLLTVIIGYAGDLTERLDTSDPLRKKAEEIARSGQRAASLTRQLLAFSRQQVLEPKVLNLNSVVDDLKKMLRRLINEDIELITALDPELGQVKADQGQIEQVIVNLAVNARDAMPRGGKLTIETTNVKVDEVLARQHPPISPGSFALLTVTDTGVGMDAETQSRIFEPFFTTKDRGKGTGLGLATVYGVVKQSGGFMRVSSELGHGTTFEILLPRIDERVQAIAQDPSSRATWRGSETILLVEDDEALRELILDSLSARGYAVLEAANGSEALQIARQRSGKIDLLLTDVVMPGMSGPQVADGIVAPYPHVKVLYMSGYPEFAAGREELLRQGRRLLQKPYTLRNLAHAVRETLETNSVPELSSQ